MKKGKVSQAERERRQEGIKQAILMVNNVAKLRLSPSEVHGVGVFAIRNIRKGERVYASAIPVMLDIPYREFKNILPEIVEAILQRFPRVVDGSHFMCPDTLMQMYMNHSDEPNYDNQTDKALKGIKKGEEVFENYKSIKGWEKVYKWLE